MALNLEKQLRFYGAYHHDPVNIGIHMICVPIILLSAFLLGTNSGTLIPLPDYATVPHFELNLGTIACLAYCALYILLEPVAGTALSTVLIAGTVAGDYLLRTYGNVVNYWAVGAHVVSWIAQFVGHGKFEGRAPALLDNLFQAIFLAPLFVWLETLFAFGYRPELQARVEQLVKQDIAKFRDEAKQKKQQHTINGNVNGNAKGHAKSS